MSKKTELEDLDVLGRGINDLFAPDGEITNISQHPSAVNECIIRMQLLECYLNSLSNLKSCEELIKKPVLIENRSLGELKKTGDQYSKFKYSWQKLFLKHLPNFIYLIKNLPKGCRYSKQIEIFKAVCKDRNYVFCEPSFGKTLLSETSFGEPAFGEILFRDFCEDYFRCYARLNENLCDQLREFINNFVNDLHLRLVAKRAEILEERRAAKRNAKEYRRHVKSLIAARTPLNVIRVDLAYQRGVNASVEDIIKDLKHFHRNMRHKPKLFRHLYAYIEKIEYGLSDGVHVHLLLFYTSERQSSANIYLAQSIGEYWVNEITGGKGRYWNINAQAEGYKHKNRLGIGEIHADDEAAIYWLCHIVDYFCKVEQFIKPIATPKTKLLRRSATPDLSGPKRGRPRKSMPTSKLTGGGTPGSGIPNILPIPTINVLLDKKPNQLPWSGSLKINTNI